MRRNWVFLLLLSVPLLSGCGADPFSLEDALGTWDLRRFNGIEVSGTAPTGVWVREGVGGDSSVVVIESIVLELGTASSCRWTFDDGIQGADIEDDCEYAVAEDGVITVTVAGRGHEGTGSGAEMTLRDGATNELTFSKRL